MKKAPNTVLGAYIVLLTQLFYFKLFLSKMMVNI